MKRFIVIVLDSFGIGYMEDAALVRKQDVGANTLKHILREVPNLKLKNLEKMGIMNALGKDYKEMKKSKAATFGKSALMHDGADTFLGHQEIMGTRPQKPLMEPFSKSIEKVKSALEKEGYNVEYKIKDNLKLLFVNGCVTVGDNIEADLGQVYNITAALDNIDYSEVLKIGKIVRKSVKVSRVITFGGRRTSPSNILAAMEAKEGKYLGINAPESGVYNCDYHCVHLGYGIDENVQVPTILGKAGIQVSLFGKVADIVSNEYGKSVGCVDTEEVMKLTLEELNKMEEGFICTNVQETDLAGHAQDAEKYAEKLKIADKYIGLIIDKMTKEDRLIVMADHGNDPTIGHSHHTREYVPLLIYGENLKVGFIGSRKTLSDVGATVSDFFHVKSPENGQSFLELI
ncbi:phosphopentomutase [Clostridium neuense]|uniref:Phosphopentomutase n=1 Tax=Clostridium neuense TaxID=1728934 RepID=A0ABW8TFL6_9CLOT